MYGRLWVFSLWIEAVFIGEELVASHDKLWAVCFLPFFRGVRGMSWVAGLFIVSGCLVGCRSPDLFSVEELVVIYRPYLPGCVVVLGRVLVWCSWMRFWLILHGMIVVSLLFLFVLCRYKYFVTMLGWYKYFVTVLSCLF